jgi:hypothetical protein
MRKIRDVLAATEVGGSPRWPRRPGVTLQLLWKEHRSTAMATASLPRLGGAAVADLSRDNLDENGSDNQSLKWRPVARS